MGWPCEASRHNCVWLFRDRVAELEAAVNAVREFLESDQMRYANTLYATHGGGPCWQKDGKTINEILDGVMEKGEDRG